MSKSSRAENRPRSSEANKLLDLICLGEVLIDFVATATGPLRGSPGFVKAAGGAPANVAVAASRLGLRAGFIGAVGRDEFGSFLQETLRSNGVDTSGLIRPAVGQTPLAFVSLKENAERDFLFCWSGTADFHVKPRQLPAELVRRSRAFHFGSISLIHAPMRALTERGLREAERAGDVLISCDPNLRLNLWPSAKAAKRVILDVIGRAHVVKINEEELEFLTGRSDVPSGITALARHTSAALLVTRGPAGAAFRWGTCEGEAPGFRVKAVDSTGAGDGFTAGFLSRVLKHGEDPRRRAPDGATLSVWVRYANAVGALTTTSRGAIPSFPTPDRVGQLLAGRSR